MTDAGVAYVQLIPSMRGFAAKLSQGLKREVSKPLADAGQQGGRQISDGISDGVGRNTGGVKSAVGKLGTIIKTGMATAGIAAGALLVAGISGAMETGAATARLEAQLGGGKWAQEMGDVAGRLYGEGFGDSLGDVGGQLRQILQAGFIDTDATSAEIETLSTQFLTFTDVMEQDMEWATQAVAQMLHNNLAGTGVEALDLLTAGMQQGVNRGGDLLETFQEYSPLFQALGLQGDEAMGLLSQGLQAGARDSDFVADALKEVADRGKDVADGVPGAARGFELLNLSAEEMAAKFAAGGDEAKGALDQVLDGLREIEDPVLRNEAAIELFGEKAIDLQDALFALDLDTAAQGFTDVAGSTDELGSAYDHAGQRLENFKRQGMQRLVEFLGGPALSAMEGFAGFISAEVVPVLSDLGAKAADLWADISESEGFADIQATLSEFVTFLQDDAGPALEELGTKLSEMWTEVGPEVMTALGLIGGIIASTLDLIVTIVTETITLVSDIWARWGDELTMIASGAWTLISGIVIGALMIIQGIIATVTALIQGDWSAAWEGVKTILAGAWEVMKGIVVGALGIIVGMVSISLSAVAGIFSDVWSGIRTDTSNLISSITGFFRRLPGQLGAALSGLASALSAPFRAAGRAIKRAWNDTIGGTGIDIPGFLGFGGVSFTIPKMHQGGIYQAPAGQTEGLALLQQGERVISARDVGEMSSNQMAQLTPATSARLDVDVSGASMDDLGRLFARWIRVSYGGRVDLALRGYA